MTSLVPFFFAITLTSSGQSYIYIRIYMIFMEYIYIWIIGYSYILPFMNHLVVSELWENASPSYRRSLVTCVHFWGNAWDVLCAQKVDYTQLISFQKGFHSLIGRVKYEPHCFFESSIAGRFVGTWYLEIWIYLFLWLVILWLWCGAKSAIPHRGVKKTTCVEKGFNRHRSWWGLTREDSGLLFSASVFGP